MLLRTVNFRLAMCAMVCAVAAFGARLSDKDVERLMKNLHQDAKTFSGNFKKAVGKSSIRKTSEAKEADQLADRFASQTEGMARDFDQRKKADLTLPVVYQSVRQLEKIMTDLNLEGQVMSDWKKVKGELDQVSEQFSYTPSSQ